MTMRRKQTIALAATLLGGIGVFVWAGMHYWPVEKKPGRSPALIIQVDEKRGETLDLVGLPTECLKELSTWPATDERWPSLFSVKVAREGTAQAHDRPAMLGSYSVAGDIVRFRPRFALARGARYEVAFNPSLLSSAAAQQNVRPVHQTVLLARPPRGPATTVAQVYPTSARLPENLPKFYLHFTGPMSRGGVYRYIHLLGPDGKEVELPFLELDEELWDRDTRRLTLLLDPGRIKRGLKPREEVGPALEEGKAYTLVIDRDWPDSLGDPLAEPFKKSFTVAPPDDVPPDPAKWRARAPSAGSNTPLHVAFPQPLDHALLLRLLDVVGPDGHPVQGQSAIAAGETAWDFTPEQPWVAGVYRLVIDTRLEDLAGNRIGKPFEVDVFRPIQREIKSETVTLPFTVTAAR